MFQEGRAKVMKQCFPKRLFYKEMKIISLKHLNSEIGSAQIARDQERIDGLKAVREAAYSEVFGDWNELLKKSQDKRNGSVHSDAYRVSKWLGKSTDQSHLFLKQLVDDEVLPYE
eukprot:TRINITY_DN1229_c0_g1_i1.p2 TRINITY_DN1229_c0_g1~~TRINITY_DN1229_c0_g1_i1.p2  ORF type:complete len:115 (+),score=19.93 TRINITY_DN1229_c0_g1_i1:438-782(+)